jgi:hypothetical protein
MKSNRTHSTTAAKYSSGKISSKPSDNFSAKTLLSLMIGEGESEYAHKLPPENNQAVVESRPQKEKSR